MIRITYVTITYNAAKVLQRTLDSVLNQDYPNIVHLIIDGASTDDTLKLVDDYIARSNAAENGHQVQVTSEPDKGIYDAMNKGLRSLDGDYVCFLNAGDFLPSPDTVSRIITSLTSHLLPLTSALPAVMYGDTDIVETTYGYHVMYFVIADWLHPSTYRGNHSARACWYAIRPSMPAPISP